VTEVALQRIHAAITGRVQGVGYRYYTRDAARSLGLTGWVRNRGDGSVELEAQGDAEALRRLSQWLEEGPPLGHVAKVCVDERPPVAAEVSFDIRY